MRTDLNLAASSDGMSPTLLKGRLYSLVRRSAGPSPLAALHSSTSQLVDLRDFQPQRASRPRQPRQMSVVRSANNAAASATTQLLSVAPMMDWTDIHYRQLARIISKRTWLYTEMVVDQTILHSPYTDRFLWFPPEQRPLVCQLGGSNPEALAAAVKVVARYGYDEVNLNCGCPSDRVAGAGCFGAAMMLQPELVAACCQAMHGAADVPITVKCRLGVDNVDTYEELCRFIAVVAERGGINHFIIHARKCILKGLNPHQNRTIPLLRREWVFALKRDFPALHFSLNGQVAGAHEALGALRHAAGGAAGLHGVMIGRAAYNQPWDALSDADRAVFGAPANPVASRREVLERYARYGDAVLGRWRDGTDGAPRSPGVRQVVKPLLGLFHGEPRARAWRHALDTALLKGPATVSEALQEVMPILPDRVLDAPPKMQSVPATFSMGPLPPCLTSTTQQSSIRPPAGAKQPASRALNGKPAEPRPHAASGGAALPAEQPVDWFLGSKSAVEESRAAGWGAATERAEAEAAVMGVFYDGLPGKQASVAVGGVKRTREPGGEPLSADEEAAMLGSTGCLVGDTMNLGGTVDTMATSSKREADCLRTQHGVSTPQETVQRACVSR